MQQLLHDKGVQNNGLWIISRIFSANDCAWLAWSDASRTVKLANMPKVDGVPAGGK
jgi:hypothetical protein